MTVRQLGNGIARSTVKHGVRWSNKFGVALLTAACCTASALAQSGTLEQHAKLNLIAVPASGNAPTMWVGVLFHLDPGWHVYWQNPGDSGTPPKIEWHVPSSYRVGTIRWPTPKRLGSGSVVDYGYENQVLLMAPIERAGGAVIASLPLTADVKYVVCREICIAGKAHVELGASVSGDPAPDAVQVQALFQETQAQLPKPAPASWKISVKQDEEHFAVTVTGAPAIKALSFFPLDSDEIENSAPQPFASTQDGFGLTLRKSDQLVKPISTLRGLIVLGPGRAYQIAAPVAQ